MTATQASPFYTSPQPQLLAERVMKARHERACSRCGVRVRIGAARATSGVRPAGP